MFFLENPFQTLFTKKVERETDLFPVVCFLSFFISFLAVFQHEELKNTTKAFSKQSLKTSKISPKKAGRSL
jgi:hypothetical protein